MNIKAFLSARSPKVSTLPLAILYVTEGCNLECIMCSYREPRKDELSLQEIQSLAKSMTRFGLKHIVFSGGEPLMRKDFPEICRTFSELQVKQTLLTNGLQLYKRFDEVKNYFHEVIISLDGPDAETHNAIRGVSAFEQIIKGITLVRSSSPAQNISLRTVIQKRNFHRLGDMIELAKKLGVHRISFLAADILSGSFGRVEEETIQNQAEITLTLEEISLFRKQIDEAASRYKREFENGFISESPEKLHRLAQYYEAIAGKASFPPVRCNAPNVSVVIQSNGELLPCFFLPAFGNIREAAFHETINSDGIWRTRTALAKNELERCKTCVCSLYVSPARALMERF